MKKIIILVFALCCIAATVMAMNLKLDLSLVGGVGTFTPPTSSTVTIGGVPVTIGGAAVKIQE